MSYIQELQDVIRKLHGVESRHIESVGMKETFQGKTVWKALWKYLIWSAILRPIEPTLARMVENGQRNQA